MDYLGMSSPSLVPETDAENSNTIAIFDQEVVDRAALHLPVLFLAKPALYTHG